MVKDFTGHRALDRVSFSVPRGSVYGILGPNGAGKTTLLRIINHITAPDSGTVTFDGHPLSQADVASIGYLPEERGLYKKMRVGEQAVFFARLKGLSRRDAEKRLREWFDRLEIGSWWDRKVEELSKGMAQKVQFVVTVLHEPKLLIFDEPFSGFDPINAQLLKSEILRLRQRGATVLFSTHNMGSVEEICDHITLINGGRNVLTGEVAELRRKYSDGQYTLTYGATPAEAAALLPALSPLASVTASATDEATGDVTLDLSLKPGATLRQVIALANEAVTLRAVNRRVASMDNIFITAVKSSSLDATL